MVEAEGGAELGALVELGSLSAKWWLVVMGGKLCTAIEMRPHSCNVI